MRKLTVRNKKIAPGAQMSGKQCGTVLVVAVVLVAIASFALSAVTIAWIDHERLIGRKIDSQHALQAAHSGVQRALDFFNRPSQYNANVEYETNPFVANPEDVTDYTYLRTLLSGTTVDSPGITISSDLFPDVYASDNNRTLATITSIVLCEAPSQLDSTAKIALIRATAVSEIYGIERIVEAAIQGPKSISIAAPAALISYDTTITGGNVKVHWGESWSKSFMNMSNQNNFYNDSMGPTEAVRTEGEMDFQGWQLTNGEHIDNVPISDYAWEALKRQNDRDKFNGRLFQRQDLDFPEYNYEELKAISKEYGEYYTTDASGYIYRDGIVTDSNGITVDELMNYDENANINGDAGEWSRFVFVDTIDGNPPADDGSNLASLYINGNATRFMRGFWFYYADVSYSGVGNSGPDLIMTPPEAPEGWVSTVDWPASQVTTNVLSDGIVLCAGDLNFTGNANFHGSLIALGDIGGNGTPNVFYDPDLEYGKTIKTFSAVELLAYRVVK